MRNTHSSTVATVIVVVFLIAINLIAFNWTSKFFREQLGTAFIRYGDRMPALEGSGYFGGNRVRVEQSKANLIIYLSQFDLKGQSISLLKFCETLRKRGEAQFQTTLVTSGLLPEVVQLLEDKLIGFTVVNDAGEEIARRLGLKSGESGAFYFDDSGVCRFSSRQQPDPQDLQQLLASQSIQANSPSVEVEFGKGKALPSWSIIEAQTLRRVRTAELSAKTEQAWVFFLADCFSCGPPNPDVYLKGFTAWQRLPKNINTTPIVVFDSAFLRRQVVTACEGFGLKSPVYVSDEDLRPLSKFALSRGLQVTQPLIVRTDHSGVVTNISVLRKPGDSQPAPTSLPGENPAYLRTFEGLGLDVYDVDSHNGLYYVSERRRHSVIVLNERFEIQREIGGIGSAPGRLFRPGAIDVSEDGIIYVQDGGNERIQSFNINGTHLAAFVTEQFMGFAAGTAGEIYLGQPEKGTLISVYSREGKLIRSFGKLKLYSDLHGEAFKDQNEKFTNSTNRVRVSVDNDGNILVSFMLIPLIQKYTRNGQLIFEQRLEGPEIETLTQSSGGRLTMSMDGFAQEVIALEAVRRPNGEIGVVLTDRSIYVADQNGKRLRVLHPDVETNFTPEMTGITPAGELMLIALSPRNCYRLSTNKL
ncbi:MAG TPA: hypothetical protein VJM50_15545 [Pyrinomonadaceae bacterium]|nr:hypothetical protein [Pyrinomonadaceae bacterium]